jgi:hypothetical protein
MTAVETGRDDARITERPGFGDDTPRRRGAEVHRLVVAATPARRAPEDAVPVPVPEPAAAEGRDVLRLTETTEVLVRAARELNESVEELAATRSLARWHFVGWGFVLILVPVLVMALVPRLPDPMKTGIATAILGAADPWAAGNEMLFRSDPRSFAQVYAGWKLIEDNGPAIEACRAQAQSSGGPVTCSVTIKAQP